MPNSIILESSGRMADHKTLDSLGATPTETPQSLAEEHEGTTTTVLSSQDHSRDDDDDDLIIMSNTLTPASMDVVSALSATYAADVNDVRCFLSYAHGYAELVQSVLAVATTTATTATTSTTDQLTIWIWYKYTFSKQDLRFQEHCVANYHFKLLNGYVVTDADGAVLLEVLTGSAAFRALGSHIPPAVCAFISTTWTISNSSSRAPSRPPFRSSDPPAESAYSLPQAGTTDIVEDGSLAHPFTVEDEEEGEFALAHPADPAVPSAPASAKQTQPQTLHRYQRHHSALAHRWPYAPTRVEKRPLSCPRISQWQAEHLVQLLLGSREDPIVID